MNSLDKDSCSLIELIDNKKQLILQLFNFFDEEELKNIIPLSIKDRSISEIKQMCYDQLYLLSNHKIKSILKKSVSQKLQNEKHRKKRKSENKDGLSSQRNNWEIKVKIVKNKSCKSKSQIDNDFKTWSKKEPKKKSKEKAWNKKRSNEDGNQDELSKTQMEILEMEMRARAIRSLLKLSSQEKTNDKINYLKSSTIIKKERGDDAYDDDDIIEKNNCDLKEETCQNQLNTNLGESSKESLNLYDTDLLMGIIDQNEDSIDRELKADSENCF